MTNTANLTENNDLSKKLSSSVVSPGQPGVPGWYLYARTYVRTVGLNLNFPVNYSKIASGILISYTKSISSFGNIPCAPGELCAPGVLPSSRQWLVS